MSSQDLPNKSGRVVIKSEPKTETGFTQILCINPEPQKVALRPSSVSLWLCCVVVCRVLSVVASRFVEQAIPNVTSASTRAKSESHKKKHPRVQGNLAACHPPFSLHCHLHVVKTSPVSLMIPRQYLPEWVRLASEKKILTSKR